MLPSKAKNLLKIVSLVFIAFALVILQPVVVYAADPVVDPTGGGSVVAPDPTGGDQQGNNPLLPRDEPPPPTVIEEPTSVKSVPTAADMIANIAKQLPNLFRLVTAVAYVMGIVFMIRGIVLLKHAGEMRTMMSHEHSLKGPIVYLAVGAALMYFPSSLQVGLSTFWKNPNPYAYVIESDQWAQLIGTCLLVIQFFGVLAFIRGLVMLAQLGGHGGGHQGGVGKALTHIIGGIFCINIYQFVQVIMVTLGIQSPI